MVSVSFGIDPPSDFLTTRRKFAQIASQDYHWVEIEFKADAVAEGSHLWTNYCTQWELTTGPLCHTGGMMSKRLRDIDEVQSEINRVGSVFDRMNFPGDILTRVAEVCARLPEDVYEWLIDNSGEERRHFLYTERGQAESFLIEPGVLKTSVILLGSKVLEMPLEAALGVIAHEIAHVRLGHVRWDHKPDDEEQADELAASWGFDVAAWRAWEMREDETTKR